MSIELNPDQRAAAECLDRPVLVTAGAGSGKTRMLTQRFVNAVLPGAVSGWKPATVSEIVAITFTEKAAGEIAERVRIALRSKGCDEAARGLSDSWISTIHGLCSRLLRRHAFEAGVDPIFAVADALQAGRLREVAFETAAGRLLDERTEAVRLFEAFEYNALFLAARAAARELAVAGLSCDEIQLEPVESWSRLIAAAQDLFRRGATTCDIGYVGSSSDPWDHVARCEDLLGRCSTLVSAAGESGEALAQLLETYRPMRKLKGFEHITEDLSAAKADLIGRVAATLTAPYAEEFRRLVAEYSRRYAACKCVAGVLDFDDLQTKAVELLEKRPDIAARYREHFRLVMIDEFQDTDALQLRLVEALSNHDLCTVGDEKQSIYGFRGADIDVYRAHQRQMREADALVAELEVNYRSHPDILDFVTAVFSADGYFGQSLLRLKAPEGPRAGKLDALFATSPRIEAVFVDSTDVDAAGARLEEAALIADRLAELCAGGARAGDIAILVRAYSHAHVYAEALSGVGLRAVVVGGSRFFGLPEIAIMRALNRAIANPEDGVALGNLVASDFVPMSSDALAILRLGSGERDRRSLWALLEDDGAAISATDREAALRLVGVLDRAGERVGRMPLADLLLLAVEEAGWDLRLLAEGNTGRDAFANVLKFARQAATFESRHGSGPVGFAQHLDAKERLGDTEAPASLADDGSDAVRIMSIHASKGLEFPIVAVPGLATAGRGDSLSVRTSRAQGALRVALKTPADADGNARPGSAWFQQFSEEASSASAEESARVFYVACTRAQEMLIVSGAMGLRPANGTKAKHDLARLAAILGVSIPILGASDTLARLGARGVECRVRVVDPQERELQDVAGSTTGADDILPTAGIARTPARTPVDLSRLSYTQLSEFEHCPRLFWARRVLGLRTAGGVASETDPLRFGNALHTALRLVGPHGEAPDHDRVSAIARYFELGDEGCARLQTAVRRYCASDTQKRVGDAAVVRRESPFSMDMAGRFLLTGSIDLYARTGDTALVVDYKSGATGALADLQDRYQLQAGCYALAVLRDGCERVSVEFVRPEVEASTTGGIQSTSFEFSAGDREGIERDLLSRFSEIESSAFEPTPSSECFHCDIMSGLCPHRGTGSAA